MRRVQTLVLLALLSLMLRPTTLTAQNQAEDVAWLLQSINCLRQSLGSPPLVLNDALTRAANRQSHNLSYDNLTNFHVGLDGSTPTTRTQDEGYTGSVGENVASGRTVEDVFRWWLGSPVHYENMTNAHWKDIGIGVDDGPHGLWYTLDFGAMNWEVLPLTSLLPCDGSAQPILILGEDLPTETPTAGPSPTPLPPTPTVTSFDEHGYIQHAIQSGETPGLIILKYGYAWGDLPALMELNNMTEADARRLNVGDIFLVPPRDLTPVPTEEASEILDVASDTPMPDESLLLAASALTASFVTSTDMPSSTHLPTVTSMPTATPTLTIVSTETLLPSVTPALTSTSVPAPTLVVTETLLPPVTFTSMGIVPQVGEAVSVTALPETLLVSPSPVPQVAAVGTPIPITMFAPVPPAPSAPTSDMSQPIIVVLAVVVVVQALIIVALWGRGRRKW